VRLQLLDVLGGFLRTQALYAVAVLGVADLVEDEPVTVEELAGRVGADPSALYRVMRVLAATGIFSEAATGAFVSTPLSAALRSDQPQSVRHMAMFQGSVTYRAAGRCCGRCGRASRPPRRCSACRSSSISPATRTAARSSTRRWAAARAPARTPR